MSPVLLKYARRLFRKCAGTFSAVLVLGMFPVFAGKLAAEVRISGFADIGLGSWSGIGDLTASDNLCVYNSDSENYHVTVNGQGGGFNLSDGGSGSIPFEVCFGRTLGGCSNLNHGQVSPQIDGANTSSAGCGGGNNAVIRVTVRSTALSAAKAGNYSAVLTVLLEPG